MDIFHVKQDIHSYTYPIIKISMAVISIVFLICRKYFFVIDNLAIRVAVSIVSVIVCLVLIYCTYISCFELCQAYENRKTAMRTVKIEQATPYSELQLVDLVINNDIIDIKIIYENAVISIGSSSECDPWDSNFYDKRFYIATNEIKTVEEFIAALQVCKVNQMFYVVSIDGIPSEKL